MNKTLDGNNIKPVLEKVYSFEEAVAAYQHLAKGAFGKIVIKVS
jgi:NADPH:quinone reductase-like Zn-dependent oxidoreductase